MKNKYDYELPIPNNIQNELKKTTMPQKAITRKQNAGRIPKSNSSIIWCYTMPIVKQL